jgi:hypothetical protein
MTRCNPMNGWIGVGLLVLRNCLALADLFVPLVFPNQRAKLCFG